MRIHTYSEAEESLAALLEQARKDGAVRIRRRDGQTFVITPEEGSQSPLDVEGVDLHLTAAEIISFIHEGRRERN